MWLGAQCLAWVIESKATEADSSVGALRILLWGPSLFHMLSGGVRVLAKMSGLSGPQSLHLTNGNPNTVAGFGGSDRTRQVSGDGLALGGSWGQEGRGTDLQRGVDTG